MSDVNTPDSARCLWWITTDLPGGQVACQTSGGIDRARECIQQHMVGRFEPRIFTLRLAPDDVVEWIDHPRGACARTRAEGGWMMQRQVGGIKELNGACALALLFVPVPMTENITLLVDEAEEKE